MYGVVSSDKRVQINNEIINKTDKLLHINTDINKQYYQIN